MNNEIDFLEPVLKRSKWSNPEEEEIWIDGSEWIRQTFEHGKLFLFDFLRYICIDVSACDTLNCITPPELPVSSVGSRGIHNYCGFFNLSGKHFAVGGVGKVSPNTIASCYPVDVFEVHFICKPGSSLPQVEYVATTLFKPMHCCKTAAWAIPAKGKVYVICRAFTSDSKGSFEVLDLKSGYWTPLPEPPFHPGCCGKDSNHTVRVTGRYVVGSRLYFTVGCRVYGTRYFVFDTQIDKWEDVSSTLISWFRHPVDVPHQAITVSVPGLKHEVILSYYFPYHAYGEKGCRKLFAILVASGGYPLCYQEIFSEVHVVPPRAVINMRAGFFDLGNGLKFAVMTVDGGTTYLSWSIFELLASNSSAAAAIDEAPEVGPPDDSCSLQEIEFVKVRVRHKHISKAGRHRVWGFDGALLV